MAFGEVFGALFGNMGFIRFIRLIAARKKVEDSVRLLLAEEKSC